MEFFIGTIYKLFQIIFITVTVAIVINRNSFPLSNERFKSLTKYVVCKEA